MKQATSIAGSIAAIVSSLATLACCFPLGFAAALGAGVASPFFAKLRPWLLVLSVAFIGLGFWQQHRAKKCSLRGRWVGNVFLWAAVVVVVAMILFPQQVAALLAGRSPK